MGVTERETCNNFILVMTGRVFFIKTLHIYQVNPNLLELYILNPHSYLIFVTLFDLVVT